MKTTIITIKRAVIPILRKNNVQKAGLFGSYARGEQGKNSDIDILVKLPRSVGLIEMIRLKNLLESKLNKKVDLVEYEMIRTEWKSSILSEEIRLV